MLREAKLSLLLCAFTSAHVVELFTFSQPFSLSKEHFFFFFFFSFLGPPHRIFAFPRLGWYWGAGAAGEGAGAGGGGGGSLEYE